jgi:hypothetical protein
MIKGLYFYSMQKGQNLFTSKNSRSSHESRVCHIWYGQVASVLSLLFQMHQLKIKAMTQSIVSTGNKFFDQFPIYHIKMLLADFDANLAGEDIFKLTVWNNHICLHI